MRYVCCGTLSNCKVLQQSALQYRRTRSETAMARTIPKIVNATLSDQRGNETVAIVVGAPAWFAWLDRRRLFALVDGPRTLTVGKEQCRNGWYWYAYARRDWKLHRCYLGRSGDLSV